MPLESGLLEILACPACRAPLKEQGPASQDDGVSHDQGAAQPGGTARTGEEPDGHAVLTEDDTPEASELLCTSNDCGLVYPVQDGIPVLLVDEARRPA